MCIHSFSISMYALVTYSVTIRCKKLCTQKRKLLFHHLLHIIIIDKFCEKNWKSPVIMVFKGIYFSSLQNFALFSKVFLSMNEVLVFKKTFISLFRKRHGNKWPKPSRASSMVCRFDIVSSALTKFNYILKLHVDFSSIIF